MNLFRLSIGLDYTQVDIVFHCQSPHYSIKYSSYIKNLGKLVIRKNDLHTVSSMIQLSNGLTLAPLTVTIQIDHAVHEIHTFMSAETNSSFQWGKSTICVWLIWCFALTTDRSNNGIVFTPECV